MMEVSVYVKYSNTVLPDQLCGSIQKGVYERDNKFRIIDVGAPNKTYLIDVNHVERDINKIRAYLNLLGISENNLKIRSALVLKHFFFNYPVDQETETSPENVYKAAQVIMFLWSSITYNGSIYPTLIIVFSNRYN